MKVLLKVYSKIIDYLSKHAKLAFILSHGGIHLFVLLVLILFSLSLYIQTNRYNQINLSRISFSIDELSDETFYIDTGIEMTDAEQEAAEYEAIKACSPDKYFVYSIYGDIYIHGGEYYLSDESPESPNIFLREIPNGFTYINFGYKYEFDSELALEDRPDTIIANKFITISSENHDSDFQIDTTTYIKISQFKRIQKSSYDDGKRVFQYFYNDTTINTFKDKDLYDNEYEIPILFHGDYIYETKNNKSPITAFYIDLNGVCLNDVEWPDSIVKGCLSIYFGIENDLNGSIDPYEIKYVHPQPDVITPFKIEYSSPKSINSILTNNGIYLIIENIHAKNIIDTKRTQYSVLIGALIAFMLDIIVNLILKWRRLSKLRSKSVKKQIIKRKRR